MYKLLRRAYAVFRAYMLNDLVRSKGFVYGLISFSMWIVMFVTPMYLFVGSNVDPSEIATYGFTAIFIFMVYSIATWDWAAELRWMINHGILEYYIVSNSGFLPHYLGLVPVSLTWLLIALGVNYVTLSLLFGPPRIIVHDPLILLIGLAILILVLLGYALILGGTMISSGTTGFVMEILSFILPIATGGLAPLSRLPATFRDFALMTPFSYPAELIRYGILGWEPVLETTTMIVRGYVYGLVFFAIGIAYFKYQFKKVLKEGVRVTTLW